MGFSTGVQFIKGISSGSSPGSAGSGAGNRSGLFNTIEDVRAFNRGQRLEDISAEEELRLSFERRRGSGGFNVNALLKALGLSQEEANAKNEERFAEINAGFDTRLSRAIELLEGQGNFARGEIGRSAEQAMGFDQAELTSRGLAGTTVLSSNRQAIRRDRDLAFGDLSERLARLRFTAEDRIRGEQLAFQERREDIGPDLASILPLLLQFGANR